MASIVQTTGPVLGQSGGVTAAFASPVTAGNVLVMMQVVRNNTPLDPTKDSSIGPSRPFTAFGTEVASGGDYGVIGYRIATGDEQTLNVNRADTAVQFWELTADAAVASATVLRASAQASSATKSLGTLSSASGHIAFSMFLWAQDFDATQYHSPASGWTETYEAGCLGSANNHPWTEFNYATGQSGNLTASTTGISNGAWGGMAVDIGASLPTGDGAILIDCYDSTNTYLGTIFDAEAKQFRKELNGTGTFTFTVNRYSSYISALNGAAFVKFRVPQIDSGHIFAGVLETSNATLVSENEQGGEVVTITGRGLLAYLDWAILWPQPFVIAGPVDLTPTAELYLVGTGTAPGQLLYRQIDEWGNASRPHSPVPLLTADFDYTNDSNGTAWSTSTATAQMTATRGDSGLSMLGQFVGSGVLDVDMGTEFDIHAYNSPFGTDRSSATFATNKVRFVKGVNIAGELRRSVNIATPPSYELVVGDGAYGYGSLADAASRPVRETSITSFGDSQTTLTAIGDADLVSRLNAAEAVVLGVRTPKTGDSPDEASGYYLPGPSTSTNGNYWVGDTITVHTGTGVHDYNETDLRIYAITLIENEGGDLDVLVELQSPYLRVASASLSSGSYGGLATSPGGSGGVLPGDLSTQYATSWKQAVVAATTTAGTLASSFENGDTVDGVTLATGDRILIKNQATASQNGIYIVAASGAPTRAADFAASADVVGAVVMVTGGTVNAKTAWGVVNTTAPTIDSTSITFTEYDKFSTVQAHGATGATETVDVSVADWHAITLDANCTLTLSGATNTKGASLLLEVTQDGTGGWTLTLPAAVTNASALEAAQVTTASSVSFLTLLTRDGGTTWYGFWAGSGGASLGSAVATTVSLTAAAGTATTASPIDHVHRVYEAFLVADGTAAFLTTEDQTAFLYAD